MNSSVNDLQSHIQSPDSADRPGDKPARRDAIDGRALLDRILNTPGFEQVVPQLRPDLLHRVIQICGLEDCGEIVALATPEQLSRVFDLDLWRAAQPGLDEQFDAERFGVWLETMLEYGATMAARKLAQMDVDLVVAGLAQHALVYDRAAVTPYETTDGELITFYADAISVFDHGLTCDLGGYLLMGKRSDSWEAIVEILMSLGAENPDYLHRLMRGCVELSNSGYEVDGLDYLLPEGDQVIFDLAVDRERRREKQGYVSPAQARAFLQMSRELRLESDAAPTADPLAHAYFRAIEGTRVADAHSASATSGASGILGAGSEAPTSPPTCPAASAEAVATVFEILFDAGILGQPPRALLGGSEARAPRLGHIRARLEFALHHDEAVYSARNEELAYLANTLMAGCSIQTRPFTAQEASDAAIAICNLGLENWPPRWLPADSKAPPISFLINQDLISVFQVGWAVLHREVSMYAAEQLIAVLARLRCDDREIQVGLDALRVKMAKHCKSGEPWRARDAMDVISILDAPAWVVLLALIDECPALHAGVGASQDSRTLSVSATDFEFISENDQITAIRKFIRSLPESLSR
ncbi:MAG: hypothetical protein J2P21_02900 [Chloracidobacterium sp.]|nr:hypothetical protein [Chloracidobacterium sp.]